MVFLNGWICLWVTRQKLLSVVNLKIDFTINCDNRYVRTKVVSIQKNTVWTFLNVNWQSFSMGDFYFHFLHIFTITPPLNIFAIALNVVFSSKAKKSFSSSRILWKTFFFKVREGRTVWEKFLKLQWSYANTMNFKKVFFPLVFSYLMWVEACAFFV